MEYQLVQARSQIQSARQRQQYAVQQLEQIAEQVAGFERDKIRNRNRNSPKLGNPSSQTPSR